MYRSNAERSEGISMLPFVEVGLLLLMILVAFGADRATPLHNPKNIAIWGTVAVIFSYLHFVVAGVIVGWFVSQIRGMKQ